MIVQAIKSKGKIVHKTFGHFLRREWPRFKYSMGFSYSGTTYFYPSIQSTVRKRRVGKRDRRNINETDNDRAEAEPSPDDLYRVMIMAAEGYVRLNESPH